MLSTLIFVSASLGDLVSYLSTWPKVQGISNTTNSRPWKIWNILASNYRWWSLRSLMNFDPRIQVSSCFLMLIHQINIQYHIDIVCTYTSISYLHFYVLYNILYHFGPVLTSRHLLEEPWSFLGTVLILLSKPERLCWVTGSKDTFREASLGFLGHIIESIGHQTHVAYKDFRSYCSHHPLECSQPASTKGLCHSSSFAATPTSSPSRLVTDVVLERLAPLNVRQHAILNGFDP